MRIAIRIVQIFVGVLFIVSGLVKANDPLGLAYKMQEFFELWNTELAAGRFFAKGALMTIFEFGHQHSLALSIIMITLEVAAGVALLVAWRRTFVLWLLLILIVFFTFLTGYAYLSGKFTNCGCFGDCLPISPLTSFGKDILLLVLILFLLAGKRHVTTAFGEKTRLAVLSLSTLLTLIFQWYVLRNLPVKDCLPFKESSNISEQMKPPPGSVPDSFAIRFIYEKGGKRYEFAPENLPADFNTYKYIDRQDKLIRKGNAEPAIKGFSLTTESGADSTEWVLNQPAAVLIFAFELQKKQLNDLSRLHAAAKKAQAPVYVATTSLQQFKQIPEQSLIQDMQFFNADFTVVRTAARTNPTVYFLQQGTIRQKFAESEINKAINELPTLKQ